MGKRTKKIKNPAEINVSQYLDNQKIPYKYEVPVCIIDEQNHQRIWYPDFYLPTLGMYLEVCGTDKDRQEKRRRKHVYEENEIPVHFIHYYKAESSWKGYFESEVQKIENNRLVESEKLKSS